MSIRTRITVLATVVVAVVLVVTGVAIVAVQREQLLDNLDAALERRAEELGPMVSVGDTEDRFEQLLDADGTVIESTANLEGQPPLVSTPEAGFRTMDVPVVDDDQFRVLVRMFSSTDGQRVLIVGETVDDLTDSVRILTLSLVVAVPAVLGALAWLVWLLVGRTLRPVEAIRSEVAALSADELERRVPVPPTGDEIARLAGTMNSMLDRLESSTRLQRQFVADASHELRSPLTRMRTELEVDRSNESVLEEVVTMQRLVEDLLHLARSDAGAVALRRRPVDLDDVVHAEVLRLRSTSLVSVDMSGVSAAATTGDADQLARAIRNLLDNAAAHATEEVAVSLREVDGRAILIIDDDGGGISPDERERVFERFVRLDEARSRDRGGTGLGLAITRDIVLRHGGRITVSDAPQGGARIIVDVPVLGPT